MSILLSKQMLTAYILVKYRQEKNLMPLHSDEAIAEKIKTGYIQPAVGKDGELVYWVTGFTELIDGPMRVVKPNGESASSLNVKRVSYAN